MARLGLLVAGGGIVASGLAAFVLLRAPDAPTAAISTPETLPAAVPPPSAVPRQTDVEALLSACPLVDRATAMRLQENPAVAALGGDEFTLLVLNMGDQGIETVGTENVAEIRKAFALMFGSMSAEERSTFGDAVAEMRAGRQPAPRAASTALSALRTASLQLPSEQRERLRGLYSAAIVAGIARQRDAAERTRSAVVFAPVTLPPYRPGSAVSARSSQPPIAPVQQAYEPTAPARERRGDGYWRPLLAAAEERVKRAERELEMYERSSASDPGAAGAGVPVSSITTIGPHGERRTVADMTGRTAIEIRDAARKAEQDAQARVGQSRAARDQAIERARRQLEQARAALAKLEDQARADLVAIR